MTMKNQFAVSLVLLVTSGLVAQENLGPFRSISSVTNVAKTQEDDQDVDWKAEFEKLEYRLRELEDDVVSQNSGLSEDRVSRDDFSESTTSELKELSKTVESLSKSVSKFEDTLPNLVFHRRKGGPRLELFGRIHTSYFAFPDVESGISPLFGGNPEDTFGFRRVRLGAMGDLNDNIFYRIQTEFADPNDFQFRDVFIGIRDLPLLNTVIIGNHKRPYNLDQLNSSNANVFLDRPFVADAFNDSARRFGVSTNNHTEDLRFNYRSGVFNLENIQNNGAFFGDDYQLEVGSRFATTAWYDEHSGGRGYLHLGVSSAHRFPDGNGTNNLAEYSSNAEALTPNILATGPIAGADSDSLYGLEAVLNIGSFQVGAEYMETFVDRGPVASNLNFHGGYIYASYLLTGEHMPWNRKRGTLGQVQPFENFFAVRDCDCNVGRGWGAWQIAARYSYLDLNDEDIAGGQADSLTLGLNWWWNRYSRMQFNYVNGDIDRAAFEGKYDIIGLQFEVFF